ncbi:hypothetical protein A4A49_59433, partial [Nicotiana attenuata]
NPFVEAYDKLASAVKIMSSNPASRNDIQDNATEKVNRMDALSSRGSKGLVAPGKSEHIVSVTQAFDCDGKFAQLTTEGSGDRGMVNTQRCNVEAAEVGNCQLLTSDNIDTAQF